MAGILPGLVVVGLFSTEGKIGLTNGAHPAK